MHTLISLDALRVIDIPKVSYKLYEIENIEKCVLIKENYTFLKLKLEVEK